MDTVRAARDKGRRWRCVSSVRRVSSGMASGLELEEAVVDEIWSWRSLANAGRVSDMK